jgi:uncharacterized membrane protein YdfJ with MMPL/SSD domain
VQRLMLRLDALVQRRRRLVIAAWVVALLAALPLATKQSDHLTGGGFGVPGSQSERVENALARDFDRAQAASLGAVLVPGRDASASEVRGAVDELASAAAKVDNVALTAPARRAALARATRGRPVIVPLRVDVPETEAPDVATDLRDALKLGDGGGRSGPVATHLLGQGALWAGLQDVTKADLASAEATGLHRRTDPARGVRLARRGGAAARARRDLRDDHGRADLPPFAAARDVDLREQHGVDDRHRRRGRLLAVRARPLPRGSAVGPRA